MGVQSSDVDAAVLAALAADAPLRTLCPDGVHWQIATPGASRYVQVWLVGHADEYALAGQIAAERFTYVVQAVLREKSFVNAQAAGKRIHAVLQDRKLTATGYHPASAVMRSEYIHDTQVDELTDERFQHCGGHYDISISPL